MKRLIFKSKLTVTTSNGDVETIDSFNMLDDSTILCISEAVDESLETYCIAFTTVGKFMIAESFKDVMNKLGVTFEQPDKIHSY